jgi:antitoxin PrlF
MSEATITSKGQLTLPKDIRDQAGLKAGDKVDLRMESNGKISISPMTLKAKDLSGILSTHKRKQPLSPEQMDEELKKYFRQKYLRYQRQ